MTGVIVKGVGGFYYVRSDEDGGIYQCHGRGIFKKNGIMLVVGDRVKFEIPQMGDALITEIFPRKNIFIRPPVSNVDILVVVTAVRDPKPVLSVTDRLLIAAEQGDIEAILCINKMDFVNNNRDATIGGIYEKIYPVLFMSCAFDKNAADPLKEIIKDRSVVLAGPSGAGKSTLLNMLIPDARVDTGEISSKTQRGRHTTRHVEIFQTDAGADIYDTPGFTSFELQSFDERDLDRYYPEMTPYHGKCRYADCTHIDEPGCSIKEAVDKGIINKTRYDSYKARFEELKNMSKY